MTTVEHLITDHMDVWSSAIKQKSVSGRGSSSKQELYGIKKLRELILELAVRGLLVPQNHNDNSANELLVNSQEAKQSLLDSGRIKRSRSKKNIEEEHFYTYPKNWASTKLEDLMNVLNGRAYKKPEMLSEGTAILRVGNLFTSNEWYYSDLELEEDKYIDNGDLIYAWSASFGPFIWDGGKVIYHYHIWKMDIYSDQCLDKKFSKLFLEAISERIKASGNGIAMIHMTKERMEKIIHPLPPLEEQKRIVAKVDELMALCDQLEAEQENSLSAHQTLVETLLAALVEGVNNAADNSSFEEAWARIANHFDTLFTTEKSIEQLKQTILQLAVMGKLVPQDPNDEPASVLLEKIAAEKEQLIKDKKIKKQKALPEIGDDEKPFPLCESSIWVRLGDVTNYGGTIKAEAKDMKPSTWVLELEDVEKVSSKLLKKVIFKEREFKSSKNQFFKDDVLYGKLRPYLDKVLVADDFGVCSTEIIPIRPHTAIKPEFLKLVMKAPYFVTYANNATHGMGMPRLGTDKARLAPIPLLAEKQQTKIIAKVNELFAFCDQIKKKIYSAENIKLKITDSVVQKLFGHEAPVIANEVKEDKIMKIITELSLDNTDFDETAIIAPLLLEADGSADAKEIWAKTNLELPLFYQQLKKEIDAGFICKPSQAELDS